MHAITRCIAASMFLFILSAECSGQTYADGTLVMSRLQGRFGNFLSRVTGTHYTHTGIVIDGNVCEATFPRAKCTLINHYAAGKPWIVQYVPPSEPLTPAQVQGIRNYTRQNVGRRYGLKQFFNPNARPDGRIYCSQFVHGALSSAGIRLPAKSWHTPDRLLHGSPIHQ